MFDKNSKIKNILLFLLCLVLLAALGGMLLWYRGEQRKEKQRLEQLAATAKEASTLYNEPDSDEAAEPAAEPEQTEPEKKAEPSVKPEQSEPEKKAEPSVKPEQTEPEKKAEPVTEIPASADTDSPEKAGNSQAGEEKKPAEEKPAEEKKAEAVSGTAQSEIAETAEVGKAEPARSESPVEKLVTTEDSSEVTEENPEDIGEEDSEEEDSEEEDSETEEELTDSEEENSETVEENPENAEEEISETVEESPENTEEISENAEDNPENPEEISEIAEEFPEDMEENPDAAEEESESDDEEDSESEEETSDTEEETAEPSEPDASETAEVGGNTSSLKDSTIRGLVIWGDELTTGDAAKTDSYIVLLSDLLEEEGYQLPVDNKTLQGAGTLSILKMAGISDDIIKEYIDGHRKSADGSQLSVTETGIRDLTEEQKERTDDEYLPVIFMGYNGGWNHDPEELIRQQEEVISTFTDQDDYIILAVAPKDGLTDAGALDAALAEKWGDRYISLLSLSNNAPDSLQTQTAIADAIFDKLIELGYLEN